jgi:hypothetical protein
LGSKDLSVIEDIRLTFLTAALGEIPPSLRFIYAHKDTYSYKFTACFTDSAPDDHLEAASCISTEIIASFSDLDTIKIEEEIYRSSSDAWRKDGAGQLMYLRYGEYDGYPAQPDNPGGRLRCR